MPRNKLSDLIVYMAYSLREQDEAGRAKLVKLLYLVDVEYYRRWAETLTGLRWVFYHYGPYAPAIDQAIDSLGLDIQEESVSVSLASRTGILDVPEHLYNEAEKQLTSQEKNLTNRILDAWALEDLNPLLSYVYFHTEPMSNAIRGQELDFSGINRTQMSMTRSEHMNPTIPEDVLKGYKERLKERKALAGERKVSLKTPPRLDAVYQDAMERMSRQEGVSLPVGEIELTEDAKRQVAGQQE